MSRKIYDLISAADIPEGCQLTADECQTIKLTYPDKLDLMVACFKLGYQIGLANVSNNNQ